MLVTAPCLFIEIHLIKKIVDYSRFSLTITTFVPYILKK